MTYREFPRVLQETLLGDDLFDGAACGSVYPSSLASFPCLADELEEQMKAMESGDMYVGYFLFLPRTHRIIPHTTDRP